MRGAGSSKGHPMKRLAAVLVFLACHVPNVAFATIPGEFNPMVVEAPFSFFVREFDLTAAFEKARSENKPMFIYLDAWDCPPCNVYAAFLRKNIDALKPYFDRVLTVDIRTSLRGSTMSFKIRDKSYSFEEFKRLVGDSNQGLVFPYFWLISPSGRQVRQLPRGVSNYTEVDRHIQILKPR